MIGGELFRGARGFGGELGHRHGRRPAGSPCRVRRARLPGDGWPAQEAILRLAGWDSRVRCPGSRPEWPGAMLAESAREGRAKTLEALSQVGHTLGIARTTS